MSIAHVQSRESTTNLDAQTLAFLSNTGANSLLLVAIRESGGGGVADPTVSGTIAGAFAKVGQATSSSGTVLLYAALSGAGGAETIAVDGSTNVATRLTIHEFSGAWRHAVANAVAVRSVSSTSPCDTNPVTPTAPTALIFAAFGADLDTTFTGAGAGFVLGPVANAMGPRLTSGYQVVTSIAPYTASFAWTSGTRSSGSVIAAFVEGAPGIVAGALFHI